jgi:hypothetical protein
MRRRAHDLAFAWLDHDNAVLPELVEGVLSAAAKSNEEQFLGPRAERFDGGAHALAGALESIGQCATRFTRNKESLDAFLAKVIPH